MKKELWKELRANLLELRWYLETRNAFALFACFAETIEILMELATLYEVKGEKARE